MYRCQEHGCATSTAYVKHGCRCDACREWKRERDQLAYLARKARQATDDVPQPQLHAEAVAPGQLREGLLSSVLTAPARAFDLVKRSAAALAKGA